MNRRDIVVGFGILIALVGGVLVLRRSSTPALTSIPTPTPSSEQKIESSFKVDIPDDVEKADLKDVANVAGTAIATRKYENNTFSATILADLPDPADGEFYQAWIAKDSLSDEKTVFASLGRMKVAKGGWMIEFSKKEDLTNQKNVLISLEKTADSKPEKHIMEGSF